MKSRVTSTFAVLLGSSLLAQILLFAGSILFARMYSPAAFGELAQVTAIASIITIVAGLRFDHMAFSRDEAEKTELYGAAFLVLLVGSVIVGLASLVFWQVDAQRAEGFTWIVLFVIVNSTYYLCSQWQIALGNYLGYGQLRIVQAGLQLGLGAALFAALPAKGMLVAAIVSQAFAAVQIMKASFGQRLRVWSAQTRDCFKRNFRAAMTNSVSALLQYSTPLAPMIVGPMFLDKTDIGAYFLFSSAMAAPGAILRRTILSYFNGEMKSPERLRFLATQAISRFGIWALAGLGLLAAAGTVIGVYAQDLTGIVFGPAWRHYAALLLPLLLFFALDTLLQPFSTLLCMWEREGTQMAIEVLRFALTYAVWPWIVYAGHHDFFDAIRIYLLLMGFVYVLNCVVAVRLKSPGMAFAEGVRQ